MWIEQINHLTLFKFTDELGDRLQTLLDKKKADTLMTTENLELETITELDEIFREHLNLAWVYLLIALVKCSNSRVTIDSHFIPLNLVTYSREESKTKKD